MALILSLIRFMLCLTMVQAFPNVRRGYDYGYVVQSLPQRCVSAPRDAVCNLNHDVAYYTAQVYGIIIGSVNATHGLYMSLFPKYPGCARAITELMCQLNFPKCLGGARLDYGDKQASFKAVEDSCSQIPFFNASALLDQPSFKNMKSGVVKNPYAMTCDYIPQDPLKICPKPRYKVPSAYANLYKVQVASVAVQIKTFAGNCSNLMKSVFACSYSFCSPKEDFVLTKTTKQKCFSIYDCYQRNGIPAGGLQNTLNQACPHYPDEDTAKRVRIPAV